MVCLDYSSILNLKAVYSSETLANFYQSTGDYIPEVLFKLYIASSEYGNTAWRLTLMGLICSTIP
jgi:hypothetical protein